jgi:hypothetical protein
MDRFYGFDGGAGVSIEILIRQIVKKILLVVLGSGLIGNALYVYGLSYYEGYIERLGFEYLLFPIEWSDAPLWAYFASREFGVSTVNLWVKFAGINVALIMLVTYVVARLWMAVNEQGDNDRRPASGTRRGGLRFLVKFRRKFPKVFRVVQWLLIKEQSFWAFAASYFALIFVIFVPVFIFIWVYFPLVGLSHGEKVGARMLSIYKESLCGGSDDYWDACVRISTSHVDGERLSGFITAKLVAKKDNVLGLMTKSGPITITMPEFFYHEAKKNPCYLDGCKNTSDEKKN